MGPQSAVRAVPLDGGTQGSSTSAGARADEQALVARIRSGDRAAFEELTRRYSSALHSFVARRVGSESVAEDLVQDVLLNIWRNRETWRVRNSLPTYLYVAGRNAAAIYRRHASVVTRTEDAAERNEETLGMGAGSGPADARAELSDVTSAVRCAIARLPDRAQQAAMLRLQDDLSYSEIAEVMGVTVKAVERLVSRALHALREQLADYL